jgi:hypothetical protein
MNHNVRRSSRTLFAATLIVAAGASAAAHGQPVERSVQRAQITAQSPHPPQAGGQPVGAKAPAKAPLAVLTSEQAQALGLSGETVVIVQGVELKPATPGNAADRAAGPKVRYRAMVSGPSEDTRVRALPLQTVALSMGGPGRVVALNFDSMSDSGAWQLSSYSLDGVELSADAVRVTPTALELRDASGTTVHTIEFANPNGRATVVSGMALPSASPIPPVPPLMGTVLDWSPTQSRVVLGITMTELPRDMVRALAVSSDAVLVGSVVPGSPAARAGMQADDVLVWIGSPDTPATMESVRQTMLEREPGDTIECGVLRDGKPLTLTATLEARPASGRTTATFAAETLRMNDSVVRAIESERQAIEQQVRSVEAELATMAKSLAQSSGQDAGRLASQMAERANHVAQLSRQAMELAQRQAELLSESLSNSLGSALTLTVYPDQGGFAIPQQMIIGNDDNDAVIMLGVPSTPDISALLEGFKSVNGMAGPGAQLAEHLEQVFSRFEREFSGLKGLASITTDRFKSMPDAIERLERLERDALERDRQINDRLDRIEKMLERLLND